jgi:hypothetical protein
MNIFSWNCRGLGQTCTDQELSRLVRQHCPKIAFISETRQQTNIVSNLRSKLHLNKILEVDGRGKGGSLALFWDQSIKITILSYGPHYINTLIWNADHHAHWCGTFVYGEPRAQDRCNMWELLQHLKSVSNAPWMMVGDFNEALWSFEHFSTKRRSPRQMQEFGEALDHCDVHDLGFMGVSWMFDNKQRGEKNVKVRLDRAVASPSWSDWFKDASIRHLVTSCSDHLPILLQLERDSGSGRQGCIARYEIMWEREESLLGEIQQTWGAGAQAQTLGDVVGKLNNIVSSLRAWSKVQFGAVTRELEKIQENMEDLNKQNPGIAEEELRVLRERMDELLYMVEMMWLQGHEFLGSKKEIATLNSSIGK